MRSPRPKRRRRRSEGAPLHPVPGLAPLVPEINGEGRWAPGAWKVKGWKGAGRPAGWGVWGNHLQPSISVHPSQTAHAYGI